MEPNNLSASPDPGDNVEPIPNPTCPRIVLQIARRDRSTAQSGTGLDGPLSSNSDKLSETLRDCLSDLKESSRSADPSVGAQRVKSDTSGSIDWKKS